MKSIEELVEKYDEGHSTGLNRLLHVLGILLSTIGLLAFLWSLPSDPIISWLGDHPFANWATVYAVVMIIYYGSQSFSLTFAGGIFFEGCLFLLDYIQGLDVMDFNYIIGGLLLSGFILMGVGHAIQGNIGDIKKDLGYFLISPIWIFRFVYKWAGVSF